MIMMKFIDKFIWLKGRINIIICRVKKVKTIIIIHVWRKPYMYALSRGVTQAYFLFLPNRYVTESRAIPRVKSNPGTLFVVAGAVVAVPVGLV